MEEKVDIVALGELLIDFTEAGHSQDGKKLFEQNPGGAPANLLTVASHFGYRTSFIGKVGNDMHGKFLKKTLQKEGINTDAIVEDPGYFTTLAFVEIGENGERNFSFARKPGADTQLKKEELDQTLISDCRVFHVFAYPKENYSQYIELSNPILDVSMVEFENSLPQDGVVTLLLE